MRCGPKFFNRSKVNYVEMRSVDVDTQPKNTIEQKPNENTPLNSNSQNTSCNQRIKDYKSNIESCVSFVAGHPILTCCFGTLVVLSGLAMYGILLAGTLDQNDETHSTNPLTISDMPSYTI